MEQFSLEKYLENPSRKVVTRQGKSVRIICTDRRHTDSWPIVALEDYGNGEFVIYANIDGRTDMCSENIHDLFFADEEEELTEFERFFIKCHCPIEPENLDKGRLEAELSQAKELLELARKELKKEFKDEEYFRLITEHYKKGKEDALKDLPKWKKATENKDFDNNVLLFEDEDRVVLTEGIYKGEYYIELNNLKTLPKGER